MPNRPTAAPVAAGAGMSFLGLVRARLRAQRAAAVEEPPRSAENSGLTAAQIEAGRQALGLLKLDARADALTPADALAFLRAVGLNPTPDGVDTALRKLKLHKAATLTWGEVAHVWYALLQDAADEELVLLRAFEFFDRDGNGEISIAELRATMAELGGLLSNEEIMEFVAALDADHNGTIGYEEFIHAMCSQTARYASCPPSSSGVPAAASGSGQHPGSSAGSGSGQKPPQQAGGNAMQQAGSGGQKTPADAPWLSLRHEVAAAEPVALRAASQLVAAE